MRITVIFALPPVLPLGHAAALHCKSQGPVKLCAQCFSLSYPLSLSKIKYQNPENLEKETVETGAISDTFRKFSGVRRVPPKGVLGWR